MGVRIGEWLLAPNLLFLALGGLFFLVLAHHGLEPLFGHAPARMRAALLFTCVGGVVGGWTVALFAQTAGWPASWEAVFDLQFASMGGAWGVLAALGLCARAFGCRVLQTLGGAVPALLVGQAVARMGCLFGGCCRGLHHEVPWLGEGLFHVWPLWDLGALALTWFLVAAIRRRRTSASDLILLAYLGGYGTLRFLLEFVRDVPAVAEGLTPSQWIVAVQVIASLLALVVHRHPFGCPAGRGLLLAISGRLTRGSPVK